MKIYKITPEKTIRQALKQIKKNAVRAVIVVDGHDKLLGTLSDGDIRQNLLKNYKLSNKISNIYNKNSKFFYENKYNETEAKNLLIKLGLTIIPVVNKQKKLVDFVSLTKSINKVKSSKKLLNKITTVIMAGGKGSRLEPFTTVLPKPLIPVNEKPVIDHIIEKFTDYGVKKFKLSINYKSEILKAYFKQKEIKYKIDFIEESKPLGTIGCLSKLNLQKVDNLFVTNCDVIFKINLDEFYSFHKKNNFDMTLVAVNKVQEIPYGVCQTSGAGVLSKIDEKPKFEFLASAGLYLIGKKILKLIPKNKFFDITDLIKLSQKKLYKIGIYVINENSWLDVGQWQEYKRTIKLLKYE